MNFEGLKEQIAEAGIVGAGGAGFPTHFKLAKEMDYLVVNGAECEPLLYTDNQLLEAYGKEMIETLDKVLELCQIKQGIIGIKKKHGKLIDILNDYTQRYPKVSIKAVENAYPVGDEVTLIYECTGRIIPRGELPSSQKVVEINVETLLNIANKLNHNEVVTHTYITLGAEVEKPRVLKVPIGTKVKDLLKLVGIELTENQSIFIGGPMMGGFGTVETILTKTTKAILILPKDHILHRLKQDVNINAVKRAMSSCSQCRMCTDLCPRNRLGHKVEPHKVMNAFANGLLNHYQGIETALGCCGCNICSYFSCHHDLLPGALMMTIKKEMLSQGERGQKDLNPVAKDEKTPRVPSSRLLGRLGLSDYDKKAYLEQTVFCPEIVYIPVSQHIGKKAEITVHIGDKVAVGDLIASKNIEGISANIHASISGEIISVKDDLIIIQGNNR